MNNIILEKLIIGDTPLLTLKDGTTMPVGNLRIEDNHLVHYTGKGLGIIWKQNMTHEEELISKDLKLKSEKYLIENDYLARTPLDQIVDINR